MHHVVERVPVGGSGGQRQDAWVLATNVYVVKDSRAALTGTDNIKALLLSR